MIKTVKTQCSTCGGTGLAGIPTDDVMLARDVEIDEGHFPALTAEGVICSTCEGTGCKEMSFVPFTGRKILSHIRRVITRRRAGAILYSEFIKTTPEPRQD